MHKARKQFAILEARKLLQEMDIKSPPVDAFWIAKRIDCHLVWMDLESDGASAYAKNTHFIFINRNVREPRTMFTVSHELGHIILKHFEVNNPTEHQEKQMDVEANYFAAELLMCSLFIKQVATKYAVEGLASYFGVSKQAMKIRLESLNII